MKRFAVSIFFILVFFTLTYAQPSYWIQSAGGSNVDESMGVCKDQSGNVITAGYFTNTAYFGGTPVINLASASVGVPDIYVQKTSATGNTLWCVKAGGNGTDRALAVATDNSGNIYITGFYYGTANFGSITLNSAGGSQDGFVAKLDAGGTFIWAKSIGGNLAEWGNSVAVDNNGNVFVTGQFKGTTSWGSITKTSMNNTTTGFPTFDIYTAKYDNAGNELWVQTGTAEFDDRGLDVAVDNSGNVFVCGQFSDTITFGTVHNNFAMNAVFLIKYNTNGVEQWFRRASAGYSIGNAITIDNLQNIYLTGDFKGNMAFHGPPNYFISTSYINNVFVAKYSNAGNYLWADADGSDSYISSRDCAADAQNNVYLAGEFRCTLDEYSAEYGQGTFNSVGFQDLFCVRYSDTGKRDWFRNFGGQDEDKAHGIFLENVDEPVITGSYGRRLVWPMGNTYINTNGNSSGNFAGGPRGISDTLCNDNFYFYYRAISGAGFTDGFTGKIIDLSREPYDYYNHFNTICQRPFVGVCIDRNLLNEICPDTVEICENGYIYANTNTGSENGVGPNHHFEWNGILQDSSNYLKIFTTGNYFVDIATRDGCYSSSDSIYVIVHPLPQSPWITDDHGVNTNQPPTTFPVILCLPDSVLLSASNLQNCIVSWHNGSCDPLYNYSSGNTISTNDSLLVKNSGVYSCMLTDSFGCTSCNAVYVEFQNVIQILPKPDFPDSVEICLNDCFDLRVYDSISNPTNNPQLDSCYDYLFTTWTVSPPDFGVEPDDYCPHVSNMRGKVCPPLVNGWFNFTEMIVRKNNCQNDTFYVSDSVYIKVNSPPSVSVTLSGTATICPGDTNTYLATVSSPSNSNWVVTPPVGAYTLFLYAAGIISYGASVTDTVTGCIDYATQLMDIPFTSDPVIGTIPLNAIICPNDSAEIVCNRNGINFEWHGPNGLLTDNTQQIYDSVPGFYHLVLTDSTGCVLTSNTVELRVYNTPYLDVSPYNILCPGQTATLNVVTLDPAGIVWLSPFSGSSLTQNVSSSGTYSCNVSMCGITTLCSQTIVVSNPSAIITSSDTTFCPGDSVLLNANSGPYSYSWLPGSDQNTFIYASTSGTFSLQTTDQYGCQADTTITINYNTSTTQPTAVPSYTVCYGDSVSVSASAGSLPLEWYSDALLHYLIGSGSPFITPNYFSGDTIYVSAVGTNSCNSLPVPVVIDVNNASSLPVISGDTLVCIGAQINLSGSSSSSTANYNWSGPNGFSSGSQNPVITNAASSASGTYTLITSSGSCTSLPATWLVNVFTLPAPDISGSDSICSADTLLLNLINPLNAVPVYWTGPGGSLGTADSIFLVSPMNSEGWYTAQYSYAACVSVTDSFYVNVIQTPNQLNASSASPLCSGNTIFLYSDGPSFTHVWSGPNGFSSSMQNPVINNAATNNSGQYFVHAIDSGCVSVSTLVDILVNPTPHIFLGNDTTVCDSDIVILNPGNYISYLWQDSSQNQTMNITASGAYWVTVIDNNGCTASDTITVQQTSCLPKFANIFTPNGDGMNDRFFFPGELYKEVHCQIFDRWGLLVYEWNGVSGSWDGINFKSHKPVSEGVYYYIGNFVDIKEKSFSMSGYITLTR